MASLMVLQKPMLAVYPPATLTAWYYTVGSVLTLVLGAFLGVRPADFLLTGQWEVGLLSLSLACLWGASFCVQLL